MWYRVPDVKAAVFTASKSCGVSSTPPPTAVAPAPCVSGSFHHPIGKLSPNKRWLPLPPASGYSHSTSFPFSFSKGSGRQRQRSSIRCPLPKCPQHQGCTVPQAGARSSIQSPPQVTGTHAPSLCLWPSQGCSSRKLAREQGRDSRRAPRYRMPASRAAS